MAELSCLVPVRNGEAYLDLFLDEATRCFDFVVALDDGSTDSTLARLERAPIVQAIVRHPMRPTYVGWDDLGNRNELLEQLTRREYSGWVLFLDADELLDASDAACLRRLAHSDELDTKYAYGVRVFRMVDDLDHFYKDAFTAYRLFYFRPGYRIEGPPLHFVPIPTAYPPETWRPTNLRVKHRCSMTEALRQQRFDKYLEADPERRFQPSYDNLLDAPKRVRDWSETRYEQLLQV